MNAAPHPLPLDCPAYLRVIQREAEAFAQTLGAGSLDRRVPMSPEWTLADLTVHLGLVHRWATRIVTSGEQADRPDPPEGADLPAWFEQGARALLDALSAAEPEAGCWGFGPEQRMAFWFRRQAQETAVHRHDAQEAAGPPEPIEAVLAADGVDELLAVMLPRAAARFGEPPQLRAALRLHATDTGHSWLLGSSSGGHTPEVSLFDGAALDASARLSGTAEGLLLSLWRRIEPAAALTVDGDPGVIEDLWGGRLTT
ncbi:MAG: maleylpyruvate isomerase family mycothiol-dependent enzyme [Euzebyales bacterium]|nr:maleylpyruvate isomerase family mycothiol-dependent enzyme [Euzebyales bacterium]